MFIEKAISVLAGFNARPLPWWNLNEFGVLVFVL